MAHSPDSPTTPPSGAFSPRWVEFTVALLVLSCAVTALYLRLHVLLADFALRIAAPMVAAR